MRKINPDRYKELNKMERQFKILLKVFLGAIMATAGWLTYLMIKLL